MKCPECGNKTKVTDTRKPSGVEAIRRRVCEKCGYVFFTVERIDPNGKYLMSEAYYKLKEK